MTTQAIIGTYVLHEHLFPCQVGKWPFSIETRPFNGIVSLGFGVLILIVPRALNYIVAFYLIAIGIISLARAFS
jgi:hypothetical protein